jgi:hypothetical protein
VADVDADQLSRLELELERRGLLLLHDRALPSITTLVAGEPIAGSWWGHAKGNEIYALASVFERGAGALSLKLVNGKVTFVHRRLWPLLLVAAAAPLSSSLSPASRQLLGLLEQRGTLNAAELQRSGVLPPAELKQALAAIETQILAHVASEHSASGAHEKVLRRWADWAAAHEVAPAPVSVERARAELESTAAALSATAGRVRLPWSVMQRR